MPYVTCPQCETTAYTAARFTTIDHCPLCDARLPRAGTAAMPIVARLSAAGAGLAAERARPGLPFRSANAPR